jgi:uncharacterized membrane protein YeaQ/YmgE (transglycosylase-associated protein family)
MIGFLIGLFIVGLIAGGIARFLVPGRDPMGLFGTALLGIVGSLVGGFLARGLFNDQDGVGLLGSIVGAVIVLLIYNAVTRRARTA